VTSFEGHAEAGRPASISTAGAVRFQTVDRAAPAAPSSAEASDPSLVARRAAFNPQFRCMFELAGQRRGRPQAGRSPLQGLDEGPQRRRQTQADSLSSSQKQRRHRVHGQCMRNRNPRLHIMMFVPSCLSGVDRSRPVGARNAAATTCQSETAGRGPRQKRRNSTVASARTRAGSQARL